ncbi:MAG: aminotransferase class IV, partial [SAR324 cluster bacterium]|nr:aminotransferase class IV [SAR324 cluster bacterium]
AVIRGSIHTPTLTAALPGITRYTVIQLAKEEGYSVTERPMTLGDLYVADEVFLTGTATEIAVVGEIDGRKIGEEKTGPVTSKLIRIYQDLVISGPDVTRIV